MVDVQLIQRLRAGNAYTGAAQAPGDTITVSTEQATELYAKGYALAPAPGTSVASTAVVASVDTGAGGTFDVYFTPSLNGQYFGTFLAPIDGGGFFGLAYRGADVDINYAYIDVVKVSDGTHVGHMDYDATQTLTEGGPVVLAADTADWTGDELSFDPIGFAPNYLFAAAEATFEQYLVTIQVLPVV